MNVSELKSILDQYDPNLRVMVPSTTSGEVDVNDVFEFDDEGEKVVFIQ